ncbi:MAG: 3-isopropylmalate dehydratase small subunit, partial [Desulfatitalea sp.]|nr:3-isopropylmalate dehydratase small subunit [Desulfatitalea sp.]
GSSREHAPWALEVNDINLVIAPSFARIFRQNMFNCGMLAIELPAATIDDLFNRFAGRPAEAEVDFDAGRLTLRCATDEAVHPFVISDFDRGLVQAGGWVDFADQRY